MTYWFDGLHIHTDGHWPSPDLVSYQLLLFPRPSCYSSNMWIMISLQAWMTFALCFFIYSLDLPKASLSPPSVLCSIYLVREHLPHFFSWPASSKYIFLYFYNTAFFIAFITTWHTIHLLFIVPISNLRILSLWKQYFFYIIYFCVLSI